MVALVALMPLLRQRNEAAARHSWARQHAWLLLCFFPFPVDHPVAHPVTTPGTRLLFKTYNTRGFSRISYTRVCIFFGKELRKSRLWLRRVLAIPFPQIHTAGYKQTHLMPQTSLLESREACEIKLTKPFKFKTGRSDCVPTVPDPEGRGYITTKPEVRQTIRLSSFTKSFS